MGKLLELCAPKCHHIGSQGARKATFSIERRLFPMVPGEKKKKLPTVSKTYFLMISFRPWGYFGSCTAGRHIIKETCDGELESDGFFKTQTRSIKATLIAKLSHSLRLWKLMLTSRRNRSFGGFKKESKERMFSAPRTDKSCCKKELLSSHPGGKGRTGARPPQHRKPPRHKEP